MKRRLWNLCCLLVLTGLTAAGAQPWVEHSNTETTDKKLAGWTMDLPAGWMPMRGVEPAPPMAEGFREPSGKAWIVVLWVAQKGERAAEQVHLPEQGYTASTRRVAGFEANQFDRARPEGGKEKLVYVFSPSGGCKIQMISTGADYEDVFSRVLTSFRIVEGSSANKSQWKDYKDSQNAYSLSMPADWVASGSSDVSLGAPGSASSVLLRVLERPADQSFRGFARSHGKAEVPGASLEALEPFTSSGGQQCYLGLWNSPSAGRVLLAYLPLGSRVLVARLLNPGQAEIFHRLVRSFTL